MASHEIKITLNDVALLREEVLVRDAEIGRSIKQTFRGLWLSEVNIVVEYEVADGYVTGYDITAVITDTEMQSMSKRDRSGDRMWDRSARTVEITDGPYFDAIVASARADHAVYIGGEIDQHVIDRENDAAYTRAEAARDAYLDAAE